MFRRIRLSIGSHLWIMLLLAVCLGWFVDRTRLQRELDFITKYQEMVSKKFFKSQKELDYCIRVNREMRGELNKAQAKLKPSPATQL